MPSEELAGVIALREGRPVFNQEMGVVTDEGVTWINVSAAPLPPEDGGVVITYNDVTERRHTEEALRLHESIVASSSEPMAVIDRQHRFQMVSPSYERFWDLRNADILGRSVPDVMGREAFEQKVKQQVDRCLAGEVVKYGAWFQAPGKEPRYMELNYYPRRSATGEVIGLINLAYDLTEQKRVEEALAASENNLRALIEAAPMAIFMAEGGKYTYANPAGVDMLGFGSGEEIVGTDVLETIHPSSRKMIVERLESIERGKDKPPVEIRVRKPDGKSVWSRTTSVAVTLSGRQVAVIVGQDVTARKKSEEELREKEAFLASVYTGVDLSVFVVDVIGGGSFRYVGLNPKHELLIGISSEEIAGKTPADIMPADTAAAVCERYRACVEAGETISYEEWVPFKGRPTCWETRLHPLKDTSGRVHRIIGTTQEITARKQMEQKLRSLFEYAPDAIYLASPEGRLLDVNVAARRQTGYTRDELLGMTVADLDPRSSREEDRERIWQKLRVGEMVTLKTRHRRKDGSAFPVEVHISALEINRVRTILGFVRDVTEREQMQRRLQQAQRMESIGNLAGGIAHDFNNILFPIVGLSEILLEDMSPGTSAHENMKEIRSAGKRGGELVRRILAFSRQSDGRKEPVRIEAVLEEVLKMTRATIPANIDIQSRVQTDCGPVLADPTEIHQVALNLITNAYHAVDPEGGAITVQLEETIIEPGAALQCDLEPGRYAVLTVSDTGVGIAPDHLEKIFDPYFTTKGLGKGTGIGLSTVYGIVQEHRGGIEVHSELGGGSTFKIYLPLVFATPAAAEDAPTGEVPTGRERILIVDDEASIVSLMTKVLERQGYRITPCRECREVLERIEADPAAYDLVITDMAMPGMTGDRLAQAILAIRPDIPIIVCTGYSEHLSPEEAGSIGAQRVLLKPVTRADLSRAVREVLDQAASAPLGQPPDQQQ